MIIRGNMIRKILCTVLGLALFSLPVFRARADAAGTFLAEAGTLQTVQEADADTVRGVAGLAKLPALLVLCEAVDAGSLDLNAVVNVSDRAARVGGPTAFIEAGESIAAKELMKAAAMICAGDAILALGGALCGTEAAFTERINERMGEMGIPVTLTDPTGAGLELSPRMLATLGQALMKSECFLTHCSMTIENITHPDGRNTELVNANRMLKTYAGCNGLATGSSQTDGYCGVFSATRGDTSMLVVVLGAKNASDRFAIAGEMFDHAFATLKSQNLAQEGQVLYENVPIQGGMRREVNLVAKETVVALLDKSAPALQAVADVPETLMAPVEEGAILGSISYQDQSGAEVARVELIAQHAVDEAHLRDFIRMLLMDFIRG